MATNISIYEAIGRNLGDVMAQGTPTGATGSTMESSRLIHPLIDQLKGHEVYIYEGEGSGQARTISAFDANSNRITVDPAWTTVPTADSRFIVFRHFQMEDYENAMNRAMGWARLKHLDEKVATMELTGTQYEYAVPSGFEYISLLRLVPSGYTDYSADNEVNRVFELPPRYWRVEPNAVGSFVIAFDSRKIKLENFDKEWVNVIGQAKPDFGATLISEDMQEYLINGASMLLASQRISEGYEWRNKFAVFKSLHKDLEIYIDSSRYGKRVGS